MAKILALANRKGGVAKSTTTFNLGAALAERGKRVLLVDLDPQASLTIMAHGREFNPNRNLTSSLYDVLIDEHFPIADVVKEVRPGLDLLPSKDDLAGAEVMLLKEEVGRESILQERLSPLLANYDYILLDSPPSLGLLTINGLTAADWVLIPVECKDQATHGIPLLLNLVKKVQARTNPHLQVFGILPTRFVSTTAHSREVLAALQTDYGTLLLNILIKERTSVADSVVSGRTILEYDPQSDVAQAHRTLAEEVIARA
jgi:chromosome partitioning protein